ncbi:MAG: hypothetical protein SGBAC_007847 [Bacillariaceae sp.]
MCQAIRQRDISTTKVGFLQQAVGENQYDFLIMTFCDSILEDKDLSIFFQGCDVEVMATLIKRFLNITFQSSSRLDIFDEDARGKIVLGNYALFEMGFNKKQFEKLQSHFQFALRDSWFDEELVDECNQRFGDLRKVYEMEGKDLEQATVACRNHIEEMDHVAADLTPGQEWQQAVSNTCNRLSTQYLNLLKAASSITALESGGNQGVAIGGNGATGSASDPTGAGNKAGASTAATTSSAKSTSDPRSGGGNMNALQDPPPPPLASNVAMSSLQCQLAVENLCVAASQMLSLIRTLRLSLLLMDESAIMAEEEWQVEQVRTITEKAMQEADVLEQEWMEYRNQENC